MWQMRRASSSDTVFQEVGDGRGDTPYKVMPRSYKLILNLYFYSIV